MTQLPDRPEERRVIVVRTPQDYEQIDFDEDRQAAMNGDVSFVSSQPERSAGHLVLDLQRRGLLVPGTILVQNPFDHRSYFELERAEDEISVRKSHLVLELCQELGASKVSVISARDEKHDVDLRIDGTLSVPQGSGKATIDRKRLDAFVSSATIEDVLSGGAAPDIDAATKILVDAGLDDDVSLQQLIRARAHPTNALLSRKVRVNMTREASRTIEAVLEAKTLLAKVGGKVRSTESHESSIVFTYEITFGQPA